MLTVTTSRYDVCTALNPLTETATFVAAGADVTQVAGYSDVLNVQQPDSNAAAAAKKIIRFMADIIP